MSPHKSQDYKLSAVKYYINFKINILFIYEHAFTTFNFIFSPSC